MRPQVSKERSLDHLVRAQQERLRDRQAECLRGLHVDHQLEFRGLFDREVGGLGTFEYFVHVKCGAPVTVIVNGVSGAAGDGGIGSGGGAGSVTGPISVGTGSLTKSGTATLVLSGDNTYSGGSTISAGLAQLGHARGFGTGAVSVTSGSAVDVAGFNAAKLSGGVSSWKADNLPLVK